MDSIKNQREAQQILAALARLIAKAIAEHDDTTVIFIAQSTELIMAAAEKLVIESEKAAGHG
jgi:alpha-D-ribose 1-methylphosphonate 5-triphosphate diphosphatase PhnM